jgi:hypothetical protein
MSYVAGDNMSHQIDHEPATHFRDTVRKKTSRRIEMPHMPRPRAIDNTVASVLVARIGESTAPPNWQESLQEFDNALREWAVELHAAVQFKMIEFRILKPGNVAYRWMATDACAFEIDVDLPQHGSEGYFGGFIVSLAPD